MVEIELSTIVLGHGSVVPAACRTGTDVITISRGWWGSDAPAARLFLPVCGARSAGDSYSRARGGSPIARVIRPDRSGPFELVLLVLTAACCELLFATSISPS